MKLGLLTAPFPETPLRDVAIWAAASGFESLEIACWPTRDGTDAPLRRHQPHRRHVAVGEPGVRDVAEIAGKGSRSQAWASTPTRCIPTRSTANASSGTSRPSSAPRA